ncbi:MAG: hypothetical protein ACTSPY_01465 [Candidatus Helarchaeota archaeon]
MVIYEIGIIKAGITIITKYYYKQEGIEIDAQLRGAFLSAISSFASEAFADEIESFKMKKYQLLILNKKLSNNEQDYITIYCVGGIKLNINKAKNILTKIIEEFLIDYDNLKNFYGNVSMFNPFLDKIDQIIGDFSKRPTDRFKSVLGN